MGDVNFYLPAIGHHLVVSPTVDPAGSDNGAKRHTEGREETMDTTFISITVVVGLHHISFLGHHPLLCELMIDGECELFCTFLSVFKTCQQGE